MPSFLVELYLPRTRAHEAGDGGRRASVAAGEVSREGRPVRYVRTTYLPDDEMCFHLLEASEREAVAEVARRAGLGGGRIVPAIEELELEGVPVRPGD